MAFAICASRPCREAVPKKVRRQGTNGFRDLCVPALPGSRAEKGRRRGTALAVPQRSSASGVLTPEARELISFIICARNFLHF